MQRVRPHLVLVYGAVPSYKSACLGWTSLGSYLWFSNLSVVPIQRDIMVLPDEKSSAPDGLTQCLFFQNHWLWNCTISILQEKLESNWAMCQLLPVHWAVRYHFGVNHQGPPQKPPGQKNMCIKGWGKYVINFREIISSVCLFWKINEYAYKIQYLKKEFFFIQHAQ